MEHGDLKGTVNGVKAYKIMDAFSSSHLSGCFKMLVHLNSIMGNVSLDAELYQTNFNNDHETIYVKKKGDSKAKKKVINHAANEDNYKKVRLFFEKSKCIDFF